MLSPLKRKLAHKKSPYKSPRKSPHKNKTFNSPSLQKTLLKKRKSRVSLLFQKVDEDFSKPSTSGSGDNCENEDPIPAKKPRRRCSPERVKVQNLPQDLRIGNKLIVKSSIPFTFTPKISQTTYEQTVRLNMTASQAYLKNPKVSENPEVLLQASCLYWKYPCSSILKFPRLEGASGLLRTEKRSYNPISRETVELTATLWQDAFEDLYCQWKDYDLTAFYVCSNSFTVLFIKSQKTEVTTTEGEDPGETSCMGFNEFTQYKAIITPSTRSLRKWLGDNDISYTKVFSSGAEEINESLASMNDSQDSLDVSSFSLQSQRTERARTPDQSYQVLKAVNPEEEYVSPMKLGEDVANDDFLRRIGLSPSVMVRNETRDSQSCSQFSMDCNSQDSLKPAAGTTLISLMQ
ncbi:unnamed protein product [Bursaphelenchus xylophilus]|uniref:(pine wood nematode) hypothetical protein n=1 Tax=Bursaphelenchus xylophilus TaxID=6326 RepID=A0A811LX59_BURXY|nr:unnamed protein product [Bursaphelenchus xylophilus]CAG9123407.1 unnamed protein product [Bursaphelenchus xylophilus]